MSLGAELKRRLDIVDQPLSKRLRLAENVLSSPFFPTLNREEIVLDWICSRLHIEIDDKERHECLVSFKNCLSRPINYKNFTTAFKFKLIQVLANLVKSQNAKANNQEENVLILDSCLQVIKNNSISSHFQQFVNEYFSFLTLVLQNILRNYKEDGHNGLNKTKDLNKDVYESLAKEALTNLSNFTKNFGKKGVLVESFIDSGMLSIVLDFTYASKFSFKALNLCQSIIFPLSTLQIYRSYLAVLIRGTGLSSLIEEKGEPLRTVVKVVDVLLKYSNQNDQSSLKYLLNFVKLFIYCCKTDESLIFLFNVILMRCLKIKQDSIKIQGAVLTIDLGDDEVKQIYLQNIKCLLEYNINLNINYTGVASKDTSKSDSRRNFISFLQETTLNIVLNDSVMNTSSLLIIKSVIELDPAIFEPNVAKILPAIMVKKKNFIKKKNDIHGDNILLLYNSVMKQILEIQFKLSRGPEFLPKLLPSLKTKLESIDAEQSKLILKKQKLILEESDATKVSNKIIVYGDVFPQEVCDRFGKLGSELMSWQNIDLFKMISKQLEMYCIANLNNNEIAPSVIILTELLCSCLCSYLEHNKMAYRGIPQNIVKKFSESYESFGTDILAKFGSAILNFAGERRLLLTFLRVCHSYGQLKLLLLRYQPLFNESFTSSAHANRSSKVSDLSLLHSYLGSSEWKSIFKLVKKIDDRKCTEAMNCLILQKIITLDVLSSESDDIKDIRKYIFENFDNLWESLVASDFNCNVVFSNLRTFEIKMASVKIVSAILKDENRCKDDETIYSILKKERVANNKPLLSMILLESVRNLWYIFHKEKSLKNYKSIYEASDAGDFDIINFKNEIGDINEYIKSISDCSYLKKSATIEKIIQIIDLMNVVPIEYLKENYQFTAIFSLIAIKSTLKKNYTDDLKIIFDDIESKCDSVLLKIFELSYKSPNILELFPPSFVFGNGFLELTNCDGGKNNFSFKVLKQIFERLITKDCVKDFKKVVKYLKESNSSENDLNQLTNNGFQIATVLFVTLVNFKKVNLSSEIKIPLMKTLKKVKEFICDTFNFIKWKSILGNVKQNNMEVNLNKNLIDDIHLLKLRAIVGTSLNLVLTNVIESFAIVLQAKCDSSDQDDAKKPKNLSKALTLFTNVALSTLSDPEVCLHHARGATYLINVVLKNQKHFETNSLFSDQNALYTRIWNATTTYLKNSIDNNGVNWSEISNSNIENIKLIFEVSDPKFFSQFLTKQLMNFNSLLSEDVSSKTLPSNRPIHVTRLLWSCFLSASLKQGGKNDTRSNLVKQMCCSFYFWLRKTNSTLPGQLDRKTEEDEELHPEENADRKGATIVSKENLEIMSAYFEIMVEFVSTKKMILSSSLIDIIIQLPVIVTFDIDSCQNHGDGVSLKVFSTTFDKCLMLVNALLIHRSELLQDRWPCFLQAYRKLLKCLCTRSHTDKVTGIEEIETLVNMARNVERLTQSMVKNEKHDLSRIASYLIADIVSNFQRVPIQPRVKFHLQNCVYCLLQLMDTHAVGFLMRNLPSRMLFQQIYNTYNSYYKYTGS